MKCEHDFFKLRTFPNSITVVCAFCGQIRDIHYNGTVFVIKEKGTVRHGEEAKD